MKSYTKNGFTLIELIFVIVIIGVLTSVAIPKFAHLIDNSKIAAELATASSVQSALDAVHGEWITNTCTFNWGNGQKSDDAAPGGLNPSGYPNTLDNLAIFDRIFKTKTSDWNTKVCPTPSADITCYTGPASDLTKGAKSRNLANKPEMGEWWEYNSTAGTFNLKP